MMAAYYMRVNRSMDKLETEVINDGTCIYSGLLAPLINFLSYLGRFVVQPRPSIPLLLQ